MVCLTSALTLRIYDVTPFELNVPAEALDDLRTRLHATRWPEPATDPEWRTSSDTSACVMDWSIDA
jgi:Epoxide hydrolase N terminus